MYNSPMENSLWLIMFRRLCQVLEPGDVRFASLGTLSHIAEVDAYWNDIQRRFDMSELECTIIIPSPVKNG
jgi:hypothetical protein